MHYYQFNISVWALHTSHLTVEEDGVYRRLLDYYYDTESPIPKETKTVIRRLRLGNYEEIVDSILNEFFHLEDDGWHNNRADIEISEYKNKANKARENGKKGGRPKKESEEETKPVILANQEETESKANYELLTNNYELLTNIKTSSPSENVPVQELVELFNKSFPELPKVKMITDKRRTAVRKRWLENKERMPTLERWEAFFQYVRGSDFLMGRTAKPWEGFCFDWLMTPSNFVKILEGNYHGKGNNQ